MRIHAPTSGTRAEMWECPTSTTSLWWLPLTFLLLNALSHPLASHGKAKMHAWASSRRLHLGSHILRMRPLAAGNHCELPPGSLIPGSVELGLRTFIRPLLPFFLPYPYLASIGVPQNLLILQYPAALRLRHFRRDWLCALLAFFVLLHTGSYVACVPEEVPREQPA